MTQHKSEGLLPNDHGLVVGLVRTLCAVAAVSWAYVFTLIGNDRSISGSGTQWYVRAAILAVVAALLLAWAVAARRSRKLC